MSVCMYAVVVFVVIVWTQGQRKTYSTEVDQVFNKRPLEARIDVQIYDFLKRYKTQPPDYKLNIFQNIQCLYLKRFL